MLSILIPTYNYNVYPLAESLAKQCREANIAFEIIVLDDASKNLAAQHENQKINSLNNSSYTVLPQNIGRSKIRNLLADKAKYNWLLFLDSDTIPVSNKLISNYLPYLNDDEKVVSGGIQYQENKPAANLLLRWVYGNEREALSWESREKAPHLSLLTLNFAIKKSIFSTVRFNEQIPNVRYEDTLFSYELYLKKIPVVHIDNPVCHLGLDTSKIFLKKTEESLQGLKYLLDHKLLDPDYMKLSKLYNDLNKRRLAKPVVFFFKAGRHVFQNNLLGTKPSLFIFDLYRLGYLLSLK